MNRDPGYLPLSTLSDLMPTRLVSFSNTIYYLVHNSTSLNFDSVREILEVSQVEILVWYSNLNGVEVYYY